MSNPRIKTAVEFWEQLAKRDWGVGIPPGPTSSFPILPTTPDGAADFGLADDTVGTDVATKWAPVTYDGQPYLGFCTNRSAPSGVATVLDILNSDDNGATWFSIFDLGNANKIVIPVGFSGKIIFTNFTAIKLKQLTGILRIDSLVSGGAKDILFHLIYGPAGKAGTGGNLNLGQAGNIIPFIGSVAALGH